MKLARGSRPFEPCAKYGATPRPLGPDGDAEVGRAAGGGHGRPCGIALAGQPDGWPSCQTNKRRSEVAANRSRDRIGHHRLRARTSPVEQHAGHSGRDTAAGADVLQITGRTSQTTATGSARREVEGGSEQKIEKQMARVEV